MVTITKSDLIALGYGPSFAADIIKEASLEGQLEQRKQITFRTYIEDIYLPWYKTQVKESTYANRQGTIKKHFTY